VASDRVREGGADGRFAMNRGFCALTIDSRATMLALMDVTLVKGLVGLVPVGALVYGAAVLFFNEKTVCSFL
jgi:hypothetical protein